MPDSVWVRCDFLQAKALGAHAPRAGYDCFRLFMLLMFLMA
ncbi:hypothetical protein BSU04_11410 [Caballeronia sordidicola]|uniref:Uncharacterized protein n=1 Tax=Caballeronia sordidicola TaxID=196367 RepID=A0A226X4H3_CABSO|nr:hypothetical protein BSU04_11410 [Caballeronia sordidicola]